MVRVRQSEGFGLDSPQSPRTSVILTLWWEGAAEVRDLSLPQPPLASSHRLAKRRMLWPGTLLQQECVLAAVLSGLWKSSLGGNLELGFQVSGEEDLA